MSSDPAPQISPGAAEQFFGLSLRAFSLTPDLRFAFQSRSHTQAMAQVSEALRRREGLIVVTGAIGTGKTMLCRAMLETFETRTFLSVVLDPRLSAEELMQQVLIDFGIMDRVDPAAGRVATPSRHQMVTALQEFLASLIPLQAHAVIMIDEAQHLSADVLEEIRLLSNFETAEAKLLQIVLVGQPDLEQVLRRPDLRQLNQRVARHCQLYPLSASEVAEYIDRRLTVASNGSPQEARDDGATVRFSPAGLRAVADLSGGIPRLVNTLCDRALDAAYERQVRLVDPDAVITAAERLHLDLPAQMVRAESTAETAAPPPPLSVQDRQRGPVPAHPLPLMPIGAALILIAVFGGWWWARGSGDARPNTPPPVTVAPANHAAPPPPQRPPTGEPNGNIQPSAGGPASGPAADTSEDTGFTIAVASFRTEQRAREVATAVSSLQVPAAVRQDASGSWYGVVAGPFTSRESAEKAQAVLTRNGYADTRVQATGPDRRLQP
jgi:general secretion pathway protein A